MTVTESGADETLVMSSLPDPVQNRLRTLFGRDKTSLRPVAVDASSVVQRMVAMYQEGARDEAIQLSTRTQLLCFHLRCLS